MTEGRLNVYLSISPNRCVSALVFDLIDVDAEQPIPATDALVDFVCDVFTLGSLRADKDRRNGRDTQAPC